MLYYFDFMMNSEINEGLSNMYYLITHNQLYVRWKIRELLSQCLLIIYSIFQGFCKCFIGFTFFFFGMGSVLFLFVSKLRILVILFYY